MIIPSHFKVAHSIRSRCGNQYVNSPEFCTSLGSEPIHIARLRGIRGCNLDSVTLCLKLLL